jgi:hypothetical protein
LLPRDFLTTLCCHSLNNQWLIDGLVTSFNPILQDHLFEHYLLLCCSLDYVFTISFDLGGWCIVSTHLRYFYRLSSALTQRVFRRISQHSLSAFAILSAPIFCLISFCKIMAVGTS